MSSIKFEKENILILVVTSDLLTQKDVLYSLIRFWIKKKLKSADLYIFIVTLQNIEWTNYWQKIFKMYAEVVTFVAGSLEAGGLPGSLEVPVVLK